MAAVWVEELRERWRLMTRTTRHLRVASRIDLPSAPYTSSIYPHIRSALQWSIKNSFHSDICLHSIVRYFVHPYVRLFFLSSIRSFVHSFNHSFIHIIWTAIATIFPRVLHIYWQWWGPQGGKAHQLDGSREGMLPKVRALLLHSTRKSAIALIISFSVTSATYLFFVGPSSTRTNSPDFQMWSLRVQNI